MHWYENGSLECLKNAMCTVANYISGTLWVQDPEGVEPKRIKLTISFRRSSIHHTCELRTFHPYFQMCLMKMGDFFRWIRDTTISPTTTTYRVWQDIVITATVIISFLYPYMACFTSFAHRSGTLLKATICKNQGIVDTKNIWPMPHMHFNGHILIYSVPG